MKPEDIKVPPMTEELDEELSQTAKKVWKLSEEQREYYKYKLLNPGYPTFWDEYKSEVDDNGSE